MPARKRGAARPARVRIIAGRWRGTRIRFADVPAVRPTPDRVRETLFNWLDPTIRGAVCLDLYAGSGALGLEALSREARHVTFVERDRGLAEGLREQAGALGANADVVCDGVERYLARLAGTRFDVIFLDPPYERPVAPLLEKLRAQLEPDGLVYVERAARDGLPDVDGLSWHRRSRAGEVAYGLARLDPGPD